MKKLLVLAGVAALTLVASAQWSNAPQDIPAYNASAPHQPLPAIMHDSQLSGPYFSHPYQVRAYQMARQIPAVLHQMPCYCRCDRAMGHNSLHSCFEKEHGAECSTCMKEAVYTYQQTKKGRSVTQVRAGIERGEWMNIDLEQLK